MNSEVLFILSLTIAVTVIIGVIRYKSIDKSYYPFFYLAFISLLVEIANFVLTKYKMYSTISAMINVFDYLEFFFYTWLFHLWGLFNYKKKIYLFIIGIFFICWLVLTFFADGFTKTGVYFPVLYTIALLFFAVTAFNKFVIPDRQAIFKNPKLWILLGVIIFFTFYLLIASTYLSVFGKNTSSGLRRNLQGIISYSNLIVNLMFATAALWIPKKKNFTRLF
ncbi:hypothetical protein [Ferruginibacter sp.]